MQTPRKRFFVDRKVQGALLVRTSLYWAFCLAAIAIMLLIWRSLAAAEPFWMQFDEIWFRHAPIVIVSALLLPLLLIDVVRTSNRFAGPMFRLRRYMRDVAAGQDVTPIKFREHDYWAEFADEFNAMVQHLNKRSPAEATSAHADENASTAVSA
ncbi:MAG: hypothetical protein OES79_11600 [Planctomycetota bacterium]|nr:hypothetical protein [Planctomycetota bacterium]